MKTQDILNLIHRTLGIFKYRDIHSTPKYDAQENLKGRNHYFDDANLAFFKARVIETQVLADGLLFAAIESQPKGGFSGPRRFRYAVFDIFGTIVNYGESDAPGARTWFSNSDAARRGLRQFIANFDVIGHTQKVLRAEADKRASQAREIFANLDTP